MGAVEDTICPVRKLTRGDEHVDVFLRGRRSCHFSVYTWYTRELFLVGRTLSRRCKVPDHETCGAVDAGRSNAPREFERSEGTAVRVPSSGGERNFSENSDVDRCTRERRWTTSCSISKIFYRNSIENSFYYVLKKSTRPMDRLHVSPLSSKRL